MRAKERKKKREAREADFMVARFSLGVGVGVGPGGEGEGGGVGEGVGAGVVVCWKVMALVITTGAPEFPLFPLLATREIVCPTISVVRGLIR